MTPLLASGAIVLLGILFLLMLGNQLNILSFGRQDARSLGVPIERTCFLAFACAALITSIAVSLSGLIGFVGLVVPHAVRLVAGPDHRQLIPLSAIIGAAFLVIADAVARPILLPVGVITALTGGTVFSDFTDSLYENHSLGTRVSFIQIQDVTFGYEDQPVLKDLSLAVEKHSFWAIVGPNGSGKSTFLNLLSGQLKPRRGTIHIDDEPVSSFSTRRLAGVLSMVRQEFVPVFGFSVRETVMMARFYRKKTSLFEEPEDAAAVESALRATDTLDFSDRPLGASQRWRTAACFYCPGSGSGNPDFAVG